MPLMNAMTGPALKLAEPSIWRRYHSPRVSDSKLSLVNFSAPSGKCPQKMTMSAFSGKPRQQYARMLADLALGARDAAIVYNLDRLHRRPVELEEFVTLCESVGVRDVATVDRRHRSR